jgi:hypothetical protein
VLKGVVVQIKKIQQMTVSEPPISRNMITFTTAIVQEHLAACDQGIKEIQEAFTAYSTLFNDQCVLFIYFNLS